MGLGTQIDPLNNQVISIARLGWEKAGLYITAAGGIELRDKDGRVFSADSSIKTLPAAFSSSWNQSVATLAPSVTDSGGPGAATGSAGTDPLTLYNQYSTAYTAPANTYYVNLGGALTVRYNGASVSFGAGSGGNNGTAPATPFQTIASAITAVNAATGTCKVVVVSNKYPRQSAFGTTAPNKDVAWVFCGGPCEIGSFDLSGTQAWATDGTFTNCSSVARNGPNNVYDLLRRDPQTGAYVEFTYVSTTALCNQRPNTWTFSAGTVYLNRGDGLVANADTNTRVTVNVFNIFWSYDATTKVPNFLFYCDPTSYRISDGIPTSVSFQGGDVGAVRIISSDTNPATNKAIVFGPGFSFEFGGGLTSGYALNGFSVDCIKGITALFGCTSRCNSADGFNFHNSLSGAIANFAPQSLTVNCTGLNNGRGTNTSNNGVTWHENCVHADIAGYYQYNRGGTIGSIGSTSPVAFSKGYLLSTRALDDQGDTMNGGTFPPMAVFANTNSQVWLENDYLSLPAGSIGINAFTGSTVLRKNQWPVSSRLVNGGPGTVGTWTT